MQIPGSVALLLEMGMQTIELLADLCDQKLGSSHVCLNKPSPMIQIPALARGPLS